MKTFASHSNPDKYRHWQASQIRSVLSREISFLKTKFKNLNCACNRFYKMHSVYPDYICDCLLQSVLLGIHFQITFNNAIAFNQKLNADQNRGFNSNTKTLLSLIRYSNSNGPVKCMAFKIASVRELSCHSSSIVSTA